MAYDRSNLNHRHEEVLRFIEDFFSRKGYAPSIREIQKAINVQSTSTVHTYINYLVETGLLKKEGTKKRALMVVSQEEWRDKDLSPVPLVGFVRAGNPIEATEDIVDVYPFPTQFIGGDNLFMLEVKGDSMKDEGIFEGDLLFVRQQSTANNGDIVVALTEDNEATVKTFYREKDHIRLQPANDAYEPLRFTNVQICGVVVGVYRKY